MGLSTSSSIELLDGLVVALGAVAEGIADFIALEMRLLFGRIGERFQ